MGEIAAIVGCSVRTIHRKLAAESLSIRGSYTAISDSDLDAAVMEINHEFPRHGYRLVEGHLQSRAIKVPRYRVRSSLVRVDPQGVSLRWSYTVQRRRYHVHGPNALWHIDGLHALIRWKIVVHGGEFLIQCQLVV